VLGAGCWGGVFLFLHLLVLLLLVLHLLVGALTGLCLVLHLLVALFLFLVRDGRRRAEQPRELQAGL